MKYRGREREDVRRKDTVGRKEFRSGRRDGGRWDGEKTEE